MIAIPPHSSPSPATTVGPHLYRRQAMIAGHQCATQKPPRCVAAPASFLPLLCIGKTGCELRRWSVKFRVPGVVIGGLPEVRWTLGLHEPPAAPSPIVVFGFDKLPLGFLKICASKEGVGVCQSRCWVCRKFLSPPASFAEVLRSPTTFPAAGVLPEFPQTIFSGEDSAILSFSGAVVSGQPRVSGFLCNFPRFLLPGQ